LFKDGRAKRGGTILIITAFHLSSKGAGGRGGGGRLPWLLRFFASYLFCYCGLYVAAISSMTCGQRHGQHLRQQQQQQQLLGAGSNKVAQNAFSFIYLLIIMPLPTASRFYTAPK